MLARSELLTLTQWCHGHFIRWMPAAESLGRPAMVLEGGHLRRAWKRMFLVVVDDGFCLMTESGETLASASDLPAVLDALSDGRPNSDGEAQARPSFRRHVTEQTAGLVV